MVFRVVLVMWMETNTIFYRQGHGTSGFKWRKTGLSSMGSTATKKRDHGPVKEKAEDRLPNSMTLPWGVAKQKDLRICLAVGYNVIQLNFARCCSDGDTITGFKRIFPKYIWVYHRKRLQWTSLSTFIGFTLLACKGICETRFWVTFTHPAIEMMNSVSCTSIRGHLDSKRYSKNLVGDLYSPHQGRRNLLGFTDWKSNVVIIAVKGFEYSRVHVGVNAIIPASGARLQCLSLTQVSTSSRVLCVVNSVLAQKC